MSEISAAGILALQDGALPLVVVALFPLGSHQKMGVGQLLAGGGMSRCGRGADGPHLTFLC